MGKTKIKSIDESAEEVKKPAKKLGRSDELVEKLKAELGVEKVETKKAEKKEEVKVETKKVSKPGKEKPRSKKYQEVSKDLDRSKTYEVEEAVELVKKNSFSKFPGTLEAHIVTLQTGIRGLVTLPFASGKKLRILQFEGDDGVVESILKGKVDFDLVITTPQWMPKLAKVAKILGPRGLMPNPKNGTITSDLKKTAESFQAGKTEYKTESKAPVIHLALGKLSQPNEELSANIKTILQTVGKSRIKKVSLSPTMGPSVRLDLASI